MSSFSPFYILIMDIFSSRNGGGDAAGKDAAEFSLKDLYAIRQIQAEKSVIKSFVNSLCPTIYGQELVKAGLSLALFGGCQKFVNDKNRLPLRGDVHILVVGDPGLGKSQVRLQFS